MVLSKTWHKDSVCFDNFSLCVCVLLLTGFLVFYMVYVFTTWIGGTLFRRQREAERLHGSGNFWPPFLQRFISGYHNCSAFIRTRFLHGVKCVCPVVGQLKSKMSADEKSNRGVTGYGTSNTIETNMETSGSRHRSDTKSSDNTATSQTNFPQPMGNGTVGRLIRRQWRANR